MMMKVDGLKDPLPVTPLGEMILAAVLIQRMFRKNRNKKIIKNYIKKQMKLKYIKQALSSPKAKKTTTVRDYYF